MSSREDDVGRLVEDYADKPRREVRACVKQMLQKLPVRHAEDRVTDPKENPLGMGAGRAEVDQLEWWV